MNFTAFKTLVLSLLVSSSLFGQPQKLQIGSSTSALNTPFICFDGSRFVYASNQSGAWELYYCDRTQENSWSDAQLVEFEGGPLGIGIQLQDPALNAKGDILYFSAQLENSLGGKDIYYSQWKNGKWLLPVNFKEINSITDDLSPMISADENYIFFVRKHMAEKEDEFFHHIYYIKRDENRKWQEPIPLTDKINASDENYPFFCEDNKILYFASKRDKEPEGYNLYFSSMNAENVWTDAEPMVALNTDNDDIRPSKMANSSTVYYAQFLHSKKITEGQLFTAQLPENFIPNKVFEFTGVVSDASSNEPISATVMVRYSDNMEKIGEQITTMPDGTYQFYFTKGRTLEFEYFAKNYSHVFFEFDAGFNSSIPNEPIINNVQVFNKSILLLNVFDEEIFEPLKGTVSILNNEGNEITGERVLYKGNGRYELDLNIGLAYNVRVTVKNYEEYTFAFDLSGVVQYNEFEKDIELVPSKTQFEINIADVETDEAIDEVEIVITNLEKNETIVKKVRRDENGKFIVDLRDGDKYEINVNGPKGYAFYNTKVDMASTENKKLDVKLKPLKAKTKLVLNDITFETNSAELNASSFEEINRVVKLLIDNPDINIEISAHTDDVGSQTYNEKLSHKRAESVVAYLVGHSLPVDRLIAKGYGETAPVVPNDSEANRAKNRRVELKIVDINETPNPNE